MDSEASVSTTQLPLLVDESTALLGDESTSRKKPFYRARPLWLVPFALLAAITRGMTIAPRVEVFTQLSCNKIYGHHNEYNHTTALLFSLDPHALYSPDSSSLFHPSTSTHLLFTSSEPQQDGGDDDDTEDPRQLPSSRCTSDPAVQAGAARLQTIMTTTMGLLSALTTGWWGTLVNATAEQGDLTFILVSTPSSPLSRHGHILLLISPIIEGLLGGWSTLYSAVSAYVSDCTSSGSRAHIFSRFAGLIYLGASLGPAVSGYLIQHPIAFPGVDEALRNGHRSVTSVFWIAIGVSFVNFFLVLFVFPESLNKERRAVAMTEHTRSKAPPTPGEVRERKGIVQAFLSPLAVFLPVKVLDPIAGRKKRDWSLTFLRVQGIYQLKYLYAEHVYGWGAEQLSYYISFISGARATFLLFLLPMIISTFKPKPKSPNAKGKSKAPSSAPLPPSPNGKKPKPTRAQLGHEIAFDLLLTRCSLVIDIMSNVLVCLAPAPTYVAHGNVNAVNTFVLPPKHAPGMTQSASQALFVVATSLSSLGSGCMPAVQSLALCITQLRSIDSPSDEQGNSTEMGTGALFGALAVLQAVGQMIVGPMLFGLIYSGTVAKFPKAIFVVCGAILFCSLLGVLMVRNPVREHGREGKPYPVIVPGNGQGKKKRKSKEPERGRSRASKDLRGGAVGYDVYDEGYGSVGTTPGTEPVTSSSSFNA
ncbi:hypothetical protein BDQ17DRAFT_1424961 [Cyathus striatus]|nr:hypothetical protein BDQ17DRAFT_1424961 [Cyathus striatus]